MNAHDALAADFETHRDRLRAVAHRLLGSHGEAEDAVQEAWLRLARADADAIDTMGGWLTTTVSRICLDMLRSRAARRERPAGLPGPEEDRDTGVDGDPEQRTLLADSVGRAVLVVLVRLGPAERVAFVLHDMFAVPFGEIAPVVGRSLAAAKQLASRARRKVRGAPAVSGAELARQRGVVEAFLAASRAGDLDAILAVLAPDVVRRADPAAPVAGRPAEVTGAHAVAREIAVFGRNAHLAEALLVDGVVGIAVAPYGRLRLAVLVTSAGDRVTGYELVAAPDRLRGLELALLDAGRPWNA
ncbi:sigma-70 family RNA polymerase sigma factor [Streptantibioticus cattleyicolor]|uniref:Sigma factor, sigma 70 type, group 4 (ECF) n=1 Tax=Streptantibioticus cattleyicolor (strain ATCC 35852 / DSM 46488 / JCM 4925 / NBRC 14057 / NRRL 8057) TaxID=1003195 RepID=F8JKD9_STREN|nr:sigma-70 family RNA polymerase sigma factor [Streptantibioticus cattleyicolor]AEW98496.1 sigma factor, sigma 70 type, group 4 (ECF) [Streptantibioticus cattleyicolor NRRL 8057 = DSM 46488]CCB72446.1 putative RNA polymerase ECF-subfamily sigma factor [Streptantibioticus cattleyicolor NRRL 8057 = DSM 46488]